MIVIVSGPSGCGKSTIVQKLLNKDWGLSVSVTTRQPRNDEIDGLHYHFWSLDNFLKAKDAQFFLEWAKVHGDFYGTPVSEIERYKNVFLIVDIQGWKAIRKKYNTISIFIRTSEFSVLEKRLHQRNTETEEVIRKRLSNAKMELSYASQYDYQIINDNLDLAISSMKAVLNHE
jgi:guanylate kinase